MNYTNNNYFQTAAKNLFCNLYALIKEDKNIIPNEIDNKPIESFNVEPTKSLNLLGFINVDIVLSTKRKYMFPDNKQVLRQLILNYLCEQY